MNNSFSISCLTALLLLPLGLGAKSDLRIGGGKDIVVPIDDREAVLEVGAAYLLKSDDDFPLAVGDLENPFTFGQDGETEVAVATGPREGRAEPVRSEPVTYDDATILKAIAASFSGQVRGTMARGATRYIQLQGGGLLTAGTRFPARLPQLEGQRFDVEILEVDSDGYRLRLNEASVYVPFSEKSLQETSTINRVPQ